jgi:hypothetical protein
MIIFLLIFIEFLGLNFKQKEQDIMIGKTNKDGGNKMIKFIWKKTAGQYSSGESLYIKDYNCGSYSWDACRSKESNIPPYVVESRFVIKLKNNHFNTIEDAKKTLELVTKKFLDYLTN